MTQEMKDLRNRLDALVDRWLTAPPSERAKLIVEKMRIEEAMEQLKARSQAS